LSEIVVVTSNILGLTLLKGYGFIQYESEEVAQAAVKGERGSMLKGFAVGKCK